MAIAIDALKESCAALGLTFIHADLYKANFGIDKIAKDAFPIFLYIAPVTQKNNIGINKTIRRKISVFGFVLYKRDSDKAIDFNFEETETYVQNARNKVDSLIYKLNQHSTSDKEVETPVSDFTTNGTYAKFDGNLFGCQTNFEWAVNEQTTGYVRS
jgi:hypothetical protein